MYICILYSGHIYLHHVKPRLGWRINYGIMIMEVTPALFSVMENIANDPFLGCDGEVSAASDYVAECMGIATTGLFEFIKNRAIGKQVSHARICDMIMQGWDTANENEAPNLRKYAVAITVKNGKNTSVELYVFNAYNNTDALGKAVTYAMSFGAHVLNYIVKEV